MRLPRFRIQALMIALAVVTVLMVAVEPWWTYWFRSPWRVVTLTYTGQIADRYGGFTTILDIRNSGDAARLNSLLRTVPVPGCEFRIKVERFAT